MLNIAIVEDDANARKQLKQCLNYVREIKKIDFVVAEFEDGLKLLGNYQAIYDIVFLDIEMPGLNGMEVARRIRKTDKSVIIIFITNMAQYAIDGYEVDALDFIIKPINKYSFVLKISRALARCSNKSQNSLVIKQNDELINLQIQSIKYIEVQGHYVIYHSIYGIYKEYKTLKKVIPLLPKELFASCNRCYFINLKYVDSIKGNIVFVSGDELLISRSQHRNFIAAFGDYLGGR